MTSTEIDKRLTRIAQLSRASDWRAALLILTSEYFNGDGRVWNHVDLEHSSIDFKKILSNGTFSGGELRLLEIAASLFNQDVKVNLWRALGGLDDRAAEIALEAMQTFCGGYPR